MQETNPLAETHATLNPYRIAAGMAGRRAAWDLRPVAWSSRRKMKKWHGRFEGQKAVILCNGPSLLRTDLSLLEDVFTIGLNKINLLFDKSSFRPSCIATIQEFVIEQNAEFFNQTDIPLFFGDVATRFIRDRPNVHFLHESAARFFARDCSWSFYAGHTVTFMALQLAFHMGFSKVALIGCDHDFATKGPANLIATAQGPDLSHFDPNYFAHGSRWVLPDLFQSEISYKMARDMYEAFGRRVVNSTVGGKLEIFDREPLELFLQS